MAKTARSHIGGPLTHMVAAQQARHQLAAAGCKFVALKPGTKEAKWHKGNRSYQAPLGDVGVYPGDGVVVVDSDSPAAVAFVATLGLPTTMTVESRRGEHRLFLLPPGTDVPQQLNRWVKVDIITTGYVVAAGSTVAGHLYRVTQAAPLALLTLEQVRLLGGDLREPEKTSLTFTMVDWRSAALGRRRKAARTHRKAGKSKTRRSGDSEQRRQTALHETRHHHRHQALWFLARQYCGAGRTFTEYEVDVKAAPVAAKLVGQSVGWLEVLWLKATANVTPATTAGRSHSELALRWFAAVESANISRDARALALLHASWATQFGMTYYLASSIMKIALNTSTRPLGRLLAELTDAGLLIKHDREALPDKQATYYSLAIDRIPVTEVAALSACMAPTPPLVPAVRPTASDLGFLSKVEMIALMTQACGPPEEGGWADCPAPVP